jgi:hypothetical protein
MSEPSTEPSAVSSTALSTIANAGQLGLINKNSLSIPLPFQSKIVLFEAVRIAGTTHASGIDDVMKCMPEDASVDFVREPENLVDKWAIRVDFAGQKLGYMPADKNEVIARLMDGGKSIQAVVVSREKIGNWWKIFMEVSLVD